MAAVTVTPASVQLVSGDTRKGRAGEAITIGQICYFNDTDAKWYRAKANGTAAEAGAGGLAMAYSQAAAANQEITLIEPGAVVAMGAGVAAGTSFWVSGITPGGFGPMTDVTTTMKATHCGVGVGSNQLMLTRVYNGGAIVP